MAAASPWPRLANSLALLLALLAFALCMAFSPALMLSWLALPLAAAGLLQGQWRVSVLSAYFCLAAWQVLPLANASSYFVDQVLVLLGVAGIVLALGLYLQWRYARGEGAADRVGT